MVGLHIGAAVGLSGWLFGGLPVRATLARRTAHLARNGFPAGDGWLLEPGAWVIYRISEESTSVRSKLVVCSPLSRRSSDTVAKVSDRYWQLALLP